MPPHPLAPSRAAGRLRPRCGRRLDGRPVAAGCAALALLLATGCATPPARTLPPSGAAAEAPAPLPPWEVPAAAYGSQFLYRVAVSGSEGEGSVKLTLRLAASDRFQAQAADPLGRAVWELDVDGGRGLWLDHRAHAFCRLGGAIDLPFLPLGPLSPAALAPLLLGRLPLSPADPAAVARQPLAAGAGEDVSFLDPAGRRLSAVVQDGAVRSWTLRQAGAAEPILSWVAESGRGGGTGAAGGAGWSELVDRRKGITVRWRQVLREDLHQPLAPLAEAAAPAGYRKVQCTPAPPA